MKKRFVTQVLFGPFQGVKFHHFRHSFYCKSASVEVSQPQMSILKQKMTPRNDRNQFSVALQGQISSTEIFSHPKNLNVSIGWLKSGIRSVFACSDEHKRCPLHDLPGILSHFAEIPGFTKQSFCRSSSKNNVYYFVKYMENNTLFLHPNQVLPLVLECKSLTSSPKMFSWNETNEMCKKLRVSQLEFLNRQDLEEFLSILKVSNIFPMEAVYLGLKQFSNKKFRQVRSFHILANFLSCFLNLAAHRCLCSTMEVDAF